MKRRTFFKFFLLLSPSVWAMGFKNKFLNKGKNQMFKKITPIDFQWPVQGPFLFCVHHYDKYPKGNINLGLDQKYLSGRNIGQDFELKDGFRVYHGKEIPGFPVHPHRGFETITIVRKGLIDHADSMGAAGRYGQGDVQWMTAGSGVQHSEMFPLLHKDQENTVELFQIWLNLPRKNKMVSPDFKMLWANEIPKIKENNIEITLINGKYKDKFFKQAPQNSWANDEENEVNIMLISFEKDGVFKFEATKKNTNRSLYIFEGDSIEINDTIINGKKALFVDPNKDLIIKSNNRSQILLLESMPIDEPVEQYGPFVMNTRDEIIKTIQEYQQSEFGGWPWERKDMVHGDKFERFAKYPNGKIVKPV